MVNAKGITEKFLETDVRFFKEKKSGSLKIRVGIVLFLF